MNTTIDPLEKEKFSKMAEEWWDPTGKFKALHKFNPKRIEFIRHKLVEHFSIECDLENPFSNLDILDIGCGGGLLSEPMSRLGANVTGIDIVDKNIDPFVKRTKDRPIASGKVSVSEGKKLFILLMAIAFSLLFFLNTATKLLALIGALITTVYPFLKRIISAPQIFLGVAFGWAVPMTFSANLGYVNTSGWLIFVTAIIWAIIYDTYYARCISLFT